MKLVLISDTHSMHDKVKLPDGDVLVHAGDLTGMGTVAECQQALNWLDKQPHKHVVFVAGNHDFAFERKKEQLDFWRLTYLENSSITIDGKVFYGSPVQPWFMDWAFNVQRGPAIKKYWDMIPTGVDVLITHGPPAQILDQSAPHKNTDHLGCDDLLSRVLQVKPEVHVFGHIHGGRGHKNFEGTNFYNATVVDESYRVVHEPFVVEI